MKKTKKFKDEYLVVFNGDKFIFRDEKCKIFGITGVDIDNNKIQIRDDLNIVQLSKHKSIPFVDMITLWSEIEKILIPIVKKKELLRRKIK